MGIDDVMTDLFTPIFQVGLIIGLVEVVKKGDSLLRIAKKYLGNGERYKEIKELNNLKSDLIYPCQKLKINV